LRFVVSVALTCAGRVVGWVAGGVWGTGVRAVGILQVRRVMLPRGSLAGSATRLGVTDPGGLASGGYWGNGQLSD